MSNTATEGQGQEPNASTGTPEGQEPQGAAGQGQEPAQQSSTEGQQFDLATITDPNVRAYVETQQRQAREAREEAARFRTERKTLADQVQTYRQQSETEQDRQAREAQEAAERLSTLERENRELRVGTALTAAATEAKAFNPALIVSMLDAKVVLDEKGQPTNLKDLLADLRKSDPYLFKRAESNGGEGTGHNEAPTGTMNDTIRNQVAARRGRPS